MAIGQANNWVGYTRVLLEGNMNRSTGTLATSGMEKWSITSAH